MGITERAIAWPPIHRMPSVKAWLRSPAYAWSAKFVGSYFFLLFAAFFVLFVLFVLFAFTFFLAALFFAAFFAALFLSLMLGHPFIVIISLSWICDIFSAFIKRSQLISACYE